MANQQVKIYCGTSGNLPAGYGRFGTRFECMRCGYGSAMMKYKWAPVSGDAKPPARARKGCYRARKSPRKKSKKKRKRSPRKSPRKKSKKKRKRKKSRGKGKRSPRKKSKKKRKRSPRKSPRKKKSKYLSRAQINKLIKYEMGRRQK
jgi:hypothetical protein